MARARAMVQRAGVTAVAAAVPREIITEVRMVSRERVYGESITATCPGAAVTERQWRAPAVVRSLRVSTPLKTYRIYCYDVGPRIVTAEFIEAVDDADAIARAQAAGFGSKCEIWDGKRLVAQLEAERRQA